MANWRLEVLLRSKISNSLGTNEMRDDCWVYAVRRINVVPRPQE